jgi:hypothetical protein
VVGPRGASRSGAKFANLSDAAGSAEMPGETTPAANPPAPQLLNHALLSHPTSSRPRLRLLSAKTDAAEL